jgi:hypothetical protein
MADKKVNAIENTDVGMFAIFRRSPSKNRAHFTSLHICRDAAETEATRLLAENIQLNPERDQLFFVVRLESFLQFNNGKISRGGR